MVAALACAMRNVPLTCTCDNVAWSASEFVLQKSQALKSYNQLLKQSCIMPRYGQRCKAGLLSVLNEPRHRPARRESLPVISTAAWTDVVSLSGSQPTPLSPHHSWLLLSGPACVVML